MKFINISGFGTILYGSREKDRSNNSYITTGWITLLYFPIIPIGSYRVVIASQHNIIATAGVKYQSFNRVALNKRQVINTYLLWWVPILAAILFFWWLSTIPA